MTIYCYLVDKINIVTVEFELQVHTDLATLNDIANPIKVLIIVGVIQIVFCV